MYKLFLIIILLLPFSIHAEKSVSGNIKREELTLSIIKPDAVSKNIIGEINARFEEEGLKIVAMKMIRLTRKRAEKFYAEHKGKPFFEGLINFMVSGPIVVQVLKGENAINKNREMMGATDPSEAAKGTIRADFATDKTKNAVHGSDSLKSAKREITFFRDDLGIDEMGRLICWTDECTYYIENPFSLPTIGGLGNMTPKIRKIDPIINFEKYQLYLENDE